MMSKSIKYNGKDYLIHEPTIEDWVKITMLQEWADEKEFSIILLSQITGLTEDEVKNSDYQEVVRAAQTISEYFLSDSKEFHNEFEFNGKNYKFLNLLNLTFGEFIDIDDFLTKPLVERKKEMNLLMAFLYRDVDENGNYLPYDGGLVQERAELFKKLPVKYVNGASTFFLRTEKILQGNMTLSSKNKMKMRLRIIWTFVKLLASVSFGVGLGLLYRFLTKTLQKLRKLLNTR